MILIRKPCADCSTVYTTHTNSPYDICPVCRAELEDLGINPAHKQPADKGDYVPRFNGMSPFKDK
jgi:hypothetical protein